MSLLLTLLKDIVIGFLFIVVLVILINVTLLVLSFLLRIVGIDKGATFFTNLRNGFDSKIKSFFKKDL